MSKKIATYLFVIALMAFALAGEMKSISSAYKKVKDKALESAESDFEVSAKAVIDRIENYSDAQKDELWQSVYDETVAPGKKLISDFE